MKHSRFLIACTLGLLAACYVAFGTDGGSDISTPVRGARYLLHGQNPYAFQYHPDPRYAWLYYPLPALLLLVPFAWVPDAVLASVTCGLGYGLLAYSVLPRRAAWPLLLSAPVVQCLFYGNPFPLVVLAAWGLPWLAPVALAKPNVGLPVLLARPRWRLVPVGLSALLIALSIPLGWLDHLGSHDNMVLILTPFGWAAVLCLLRWRDERARVVLLTCCMPLRLYDTGGVLYAGRTLLQTALLCAVSWLAPWALYAVATLCVLTPVTPRFGAAARRRFYPAPRPDTAAPQPAPAPAPPSACQSTGPRRSAPR